MGRNERTMNLGTKQRSLLDIDWAFPDLAFNSPILVPHLIVRGGQY